VEIYGRGGIEVEWVGETPDFCALPDVAIDEPDAAKIDAAGLVLLEPDGRIWVREPRDHFGGYQHSFMKGRRVPGLTLQQTAHQETWEESGLRGRVVAFLGDYAGDVTTTRFYLAERDGGAPAIGRETWALRLATLDEAATLLNRGRDRSVLRDVRALAERDAWRPLPDDADGEAGEVLRARFGGMNVGGVYVPRGEPGAESYRRPPFVHTHEDAVRWDMAATFAVALFGNPADAPAPGEVWMAARSIYHSDIPTR
jgi:8-oxo-dGTP pyrophosphatase MutT (NUDIX family)